MTYAHKKNFGIAFFILILANNSALQAVLFDGAIKNLVNAASAETRKVLREDVYPQTTRLIKETIYPNMERLIEDKIFPHMAQLIEETIYPKVEQVIEEKVYPQATRLLEEKVYPKVERLVDDLIEKKLYPRTVCIVKQLAVALTGTTMCAAGMMLFVMQCEKNKIFADTKRIGVANILFALGVSMVVGSETVAKRL